MTNLVNYQLSNGINVSSCTKNFDSKMANSSVICDSEVFLTIKEPTRPKYEKCWKLFKVFSISFCSPFYRVNSAN